MNNRLIVIGAGGHGKVVADNAIKNGYTDICFVDDHATGTCMGFPIVGTGADVSSLDDGKTDFIIGVGNNEIRKRIAQAHDVNWVTLVHPSAQIGACVSIGKGTVVMAGAIINPCASIGEHCIINTGAIVEHDNVIGDYAHISPNVALGGTVRVGDLTHVGIGAVVRNNIQICGMSTIGAGAVVVKDIEKRGIYAGVPARVIR
ncbi:MAG: acetyltransferase [Oscillospiraceae bacterium]|nr:acetyltransferase [Oscillospiraceae bacterium]